MINALLNEKLTDVYRKFGLPPIPDEVIDAHGLPVDTSGDIWQLNSVTDKSSINWARHDITNWWLEYGLKRYLTFSIRRNAPMTAFASAKSCLIELPKARSWDALRRSTSIPDHEQALKRVLGETIERLRSEGNLDRFFRIRQMYCWCCDYLSDIGYDPDFAYELELMRIPGNEKGVAVRTEDPEGGPLSDAEQILLRYALNEDKSLEFNHAQERMAIWLSMAYGRNPGNFSQLREVDFLPLVEGSDLQGQGMRIRIPRIKKRGARPRALFKDEFVNENFAKLFRDLIELNGNRYPNEDISHPRPLLFRQNINDELIGQPLEEWAWHLRSAEFTQLIRAGVERYGLISPRTKKPLYISTRRLRYTFATNRVREGISAQELAEALDHSDLQHVQVYFDAKSTIVEQLDGAAAFALVPFLKLFKGKVLNSPEDAINGSNPAKRVRPDPTMIHVLHPLTELVVCGKDDLCLLDPPYSCYLCDLCQLLEDSLPVHEKVLKFLLDRRDAMLKDPMGDNYLAVQLDEVIVGCCDAIEHLKKHHQAHAQA